MRHKHFPPDTPHPHPKIKITTSNYSLSILLYDPVADPRGRYGYVTPLGILFPFSMQFSVADPGRREVPTS